MLTLIESDGLLHIQASGKLSETDYDRFVPLFERIAAREPGSVPMLIELAPDFAGWDLGALWRELKFDVKHRDKFSRIAIVGTKTWEKWGTKLSAPLFPHAEMRFFAPEERAEAVAWALAARRS